MDPITQQAALATAGAAGGEALYVDDVFSTYLYDGTGAAQTITNGIDLSGEGGLVWIKKRSSADSHALFDTERGVQKYVKSDAADGQYTRTDALSAFNSDGFSFNGAFGAVNQSSAEYASWTFRKAPGFFDVVTYTGDGSSNRSISHSLGSTPGFIIVKRTSSTEDWGCWHNSFSAGERILLNTTAAKGSASGFPAVPTSTTFSVGGTITTNGNGDSYIAYLFAHDDQSFGTNSDEAIIKCGSVTTGSDEYATVNLGFEPQFVMFKRTDTSGDWLMLDTMRGWNLGNDDQRLYANLGNAENTTSSGHGEVNSTGFRIYNLGGSADLIYIAIRRPHKPPSAGTDVFAIDTKSVSSANTPSYSANFPVDLAIRRNNITSTDSNEWCTRITNSLLYSNATSAEVDGGSTFLDYFAFNNGWATATSADSTDYLWMLKRAAGFFDVVAWSGNGTSNRAISHNLTVTPELLITKRRTAADGWWSQYTGIFGTNTGIRLDQNSGLSTGVSAFNGTSAATSSAFYVGSDSAINGSGNDYVAYLFATLPGISKVGSYTGTGSNIGVDCGFTAGARFVLIKRTDSTGDWYVWDSTRGIVSGNDPYILLNTTAAQVTTTDYIDPLNAGFTVTSSAPAALNASGGTYLFLAIA